MSKRILIAALNWGLGHATRCIPLVYQHLSDDWNVLLASNGEAGELLRAEFPELVYHELPGLTLRYARHGSWTPWKLMSQAPGFLGQIKKERTWLCDFIKDNPLDKIISDNRYGLYHPDCHCVFMGHQLRIPSRFKIPGFDKWHQKMIERFDECWIPDSSDRRLSGTLSDLQLNIQQRYIGPLSRFSPCTQVPDLDIVAVLSGPEPQRSLLEEKLISILQGKAKTVLVTGKEHPNREHGKLTILGRLGARELQELMCRSQLIICRSGYSSIMDLEVLGKKAVLVPTPGQGEQEYLALRMSKMNERYLHIEQHRLNQETAWLSH